MLDALGRLIFRHAKATALGAAIFLALAVGMIARGGVLTTGTIDGLEAGRADALVAEVLGHPSDTTFVAIFRSPAIDAREQPFREAMNAALAPVRAHPDVLAVESPDDAPPFRVASMINGPERAAVAFITLRGDVTRALATYEGVRASLRSDTLAITCTGKVPYTHDLDATLEHDLVRAELLSLPLALLVLLWVFRTVTAALLPVVVGALAVLSGVAVVLELSRVMEIAQYTINVCSLVGLGVAIDYSLFTVSRYREELAAGLGYEDALARAMATAGRMIAFSGLAVATGLAGLLFFEGSYLFSMGVGGAIVVAFAVVFALTLLPALLALLGPKIHAGRLPFASAAPAASSGRWHRLATAVMRHPVLVLVPTLAILLGMGHPFLRQKLAAADVRVLTADVEARRGYDQLRADFPELARTRAVVAVRFPTAPALTRERIGALYDLSRRVAKIPGVAKVESIVDDDQPHDFPDEAPAREDYQDVLMNPPALYAGVIEAGKKLTVGERVVLLYPILDAPPESERARDVVRQIRAHREVGDGALLVAGQTANDLDATAYVLERVPRAVGFVVAVTIVVLFLLLGSVVLPLKAVAMNVVSIAGAFGAIVWVFQEGHLFVGEPRPVEPSLPIVLFCALFGLSMDYEVLMLSRMKEAYQATRDNTTAVAEGLEKSAGLITSAAAIMVCVFGAFALARVVILQAVGFGMALAVALDATLVRVLLVPATMRLFGDVNWWAPRPLAAVRRALGFGD